MSENHEELSAIDLKIMRALQQDGRLSNAELAKLIGISPSSCWNHTQRLFKIGAILDVRARINPSMVQRETVVLVGVVLDRSTPESFSEFLRSYQVTPSFAFYKKAPSKITAFAGTSAVMIG